MADAAPAAVLEARSLVREYPARGRRPGARAGRVRAVDDVSLALCPGEMVGLLGRSGAGKSTLARLLAALEPPDAGEVLLHGRGFSASGRGPRGARRRAVQIVFQDPAAALDPRQSIGSTVAEPLAVHRLAPAAEREAAVAALLEEVGLPADARFRGGRPGRLSGGEKQRLALARALACQPEVLILDEPVAALDASVRGQVLNLLEALRERRRVAMLLIAHDVALLGRACERLAVMAAGRLVEEGPTGAVLRSPRHAETARLLEAAGSSAAETKALEIP
jgi:ABC-type glutathione transport system ATPase component